MTTPVLVGAVCEVAGFASALMLVGVTVKNYGSLPEMVALSFGRRGDPESWGSRANLLMMPIVGVTFFALLTVINPMTGILPPASGAVASSNAMIGSSTFAASLIALAAIYRSLIGVNTGTAHRSAPFVVAFFVAFVAMSVGLAFGLYGAHWQSP